MHPGAEAEALFDSFLVRLEDEEGVDFERFVADHPEHEPALRALWERWSHVDARLETALPEALVDESFFHGTARGAITAGPVRAPVAGLVVAGDYRLLRLIGQGGMGQVWEAEQLSLGRRVALKLLRPGRRDGHSQGLLAREARAGGRLTHPGLVTVYAAGEADGVHYIAQQLVGQGFTLADWIARRRSQPAGDGRTYRELAELFANVAEALQVAHEAGILHRDLKPSNILIGLDDRPQVSDFGLAHVADDAPLAARPGLLGTYSYMSPEQAAGQDIDIDGRSDVFSLGAVLYEALTLRRAFEGDTGDMILQQVVSHDPPDPRRLRSRIPEDLAVICLAALRKDRRERYPSMAAFAADLRRFLADEPIAAQPQGWRTLAIKWSRRHPVLTTALALSSAALLVISSLLVYEVSLRREAEQQKSRADLLARRASDNARLAADRAAEAERQGYLATIRAGAMHLDRGDHAAARQLLQGASLEQRGWEWRHDTLRADLSVLRLLGHTDAITAVALTGDGGTLATASFDATVRLWDGATGRHLSTLAGHGSPVTALALSLDGQVLVTGGADGRVLLWRPGTNQPVRELPAHVGGVSTLALSRDRALLVSSGEDGVVRITHLPDGDGYEIRGDGAAGALSVALAADGSRLVTASRSGQVLVHELGPDASTLLSARYWEMQVVVGIGATGTPIVTGTADGTLLAWDPEVAVYDVSRGQPGVITLRGHQFAISQLALSGDGQRLVSASAEGNELRVWQLPSGEATYVWRLPPILLQILGAQQTELTGHHPLLTALTISDDGLHVLAGCSDGTALLWDGDTRGASMVLRDHDHPVTSLAVNGDGSRIVSGSLTGGRAVVWDGHSGREALSLAGHPIGVSAAALSADGTLIVTAGYDKFVRLWDGLLGTSLPHLVGHGSAVTSVAVDGAGTLVASGSQDRTARLWDPHTGHLVASFAGSGSSVSSVALDHVGSRLLFGSQDGTVQLVDAPWEQPRTLRHGTWGDDGLVALSADGSTAAWASARDDLVIVWGADRGDERARLSGSRRGITAIALSGDGRRVLTAATRDDGLRLRDTASGDTLALLLGHDGPVTAVALSGDGRRVVSGGRDQTVRIWESDKADARLLWRGLGAHD